MRPVEGAALRAIAFFGGGTGGHIFPGVALAERARERFPGCRTVFFRTTRAVEDRVFAGQGLETVTLDVRPPGHHVLGWIRYSRDCGAACREIRTLLEKGFDAAFGLGGYASLPGILAARGLGIPVILLEQNCVPGKVNRLLGPFVDAVACPFPESARSLFGRREVTGNPVRSEVLDAARGKETGPSRAGLERRTVLVVGGSQGAAGLNRAVREALPALLEFREKIEWIHLAGDADKDIMAEAYRMNGYRAEVFGFSPHLPRLMARSDLVLGRAGGTTLAEIAVLGLPSILVPYPHHRDGHQRSNADLLERAGAALVLEEEDLNLETFRRVFREVLFAREKLESMGRSARSLSRPHASDAILDLALELKSRCPQGSAFSS